MHRRKCIAIHPPVRPKYGKSTVVARHEYYSLVLDMSTNGTEKQKSESLLEEGKLNLYPDIQTASKGHLVGSKL